VSVRVKVRVQVRIRVRVPMEYKMYVYACENVCFLDGYENVLFEMIIFKNCL
jgi:hypothetical protein